MMTFKHILHCSVVGQDFPLRSRLASAGAPLCSRMLRVLTVPPSPENLPTVWAGTWLFYFLLTNNTLSEKKKSKLISSRLLYSTAG